MGTQKKEIFCRIERCLACKSCEVACALEHSESKNIIEAIQEQPLPIKRVRVLSTDQKGSLTRLRTMALQCRQCTDPACVDVCIAGGVIKNPETGTVQFDTEKCVACWSCTMVCQFGAVVRVPGSGFAVNCDRCEHREIPACVEACPTGAMVFCTLDEFMELTGKTLPDNEKSDK